MKKTNDAARLITDLEKSLRSRTGPVFRRYGAGLDGLLTPLKWKPLVLIIGNYSSGKSTFINELLGRPVQRTGQAPTDDAFTILTAPDEGEKEIPGNTVVSNENLPFAPLRRFGETLIAHLRLKLVDSPVLQDLAIIDTPGMLDSVTEKDRGYDYLAVVGELARLSDLIILMFDPHKAGTIKETYQAIRSTLPGSTGEDRILYVMNRIDECDNTADLLRSYGTLCWNLSQMTGGKDIPRIYLTFAPPPGRPGGEENGGRPGLDVWAGEREELKQAVAAAPGMRLNHMLQEVDRGVREFALQIEALNAYRKGFGFKLRRVLRNGAIAALIGVLSGDFFLRLLTGKPETTFLGAVLGGAVEFHHFIRPAAWLILVISAVFIYVRRYLVPGFTGKTLLDLDSLLPLETRYKRDLWQRVKPQVEKRIREEGARLLWISHHRSLARLESFLEKDLRRFYRRIRDLRGD